MKYLSMTLSSPTVTLIDGKGALTASVMNGSPTPERVVLGAFPVAVAPGAPATAGIQASGGSGPAAGQAASPTWTTIAEPLRTIAPGATVQYEVKFDTSGAAPGTYPIKLIPYSADEAPEDYAELAAVVHLTVTAVPLPTPHKRIPWVLVAAAAVVVLLGLGAVWFFMSRTSKPVAQPSPTQIQPPLKLTAVQPAQGPQAGGTTVHLLGSFREPTVVILNETRVAATRLSDTEYTFTTPVGSNAGPVPLIVQSGDQLVGGSVFQYLAPSGGGGGTPINCRTVPKLCITVPVEGLTLKRDPGGPVIVPTPGEIFDPQQDRAIIDQLQEFHQ